MAPRREATVVFACTVALFCLISDQLLSFFRVFSKSAKDISVTMNSEICTQELSEANVDVQQPTSTALRRSCDASHNPETNTSEKNATSFGKCQLYKKCTIAVRSECGHTAIHKSIP